MKKSRKATYRDVTVGKSGPAMAVSADRLSQTEEDISDIKGQDEYLRGLLGSYDPGAFFRAVHVPYSREDITKLERQLRTGKPAYRPKDYDEAESLEAKERILKLYTTPFHEALHYWQGLTTSFGVFDHFARAGESSALLDVLAQHNGVPGKCLSDFLNDNPSKFPRGSSLSRESRFLRGVMDGACLHRPDQVKPLSPGSPFKVMEVRLGTDICLPQIAVELEGRLYPFGARALMEGWAYTALRAGVANAFGDNAAEDYSERLRTPFFPYKILEHLVRQIHPDESVWANARLMAHLVSIIAYFGLNHDPYVLPNSSLKDSFFPGYRSALLIDTLVHRLTSRRSLSIDIVFDAWDSALMLDDVKGWTSFLTNGYVTYQRIVEYMSEVTQHKKSHLATFDHGALARFMGAAETAMLTTASDTAAITDFARWATYFVSGDLFRPPVSLFVKEMEGKELWELRVMSNRAEEVEFWTLYYVTSSILQQRRRGATWQCPFARLGDPSCEDYNPAICDTTLGALELPSEMSRKGCLLARLVKRVKTKKAGECLFFGKVQQ